MTQRLWNTVHATWRNSKPGKEGEFTTFHSVKRAQLSAEDHGFALDRLIEAFPNTWDQGWHLVRLEVH